MLQLDLTAAASDDDDKQRTRRDIITSFLERERSYVALLASLVQVMFVQLCCAGQAGHSVFS